MEGWASAIQAFNFSSIEFPASDWMSEVKNEATLCYQMQFLRWHPRWRLWTPAKHPTQSENSWESISATPFWDDSTNKDTSLGRCSWFSEIGCYPANLGTTDNGAAPCKYQAVVAEYTWKGTSAYPSMVCKFFIFPINEKSFIEFMLGPPV